jgi:hypothetical protein
MSAQNGFDTQLTLAGPLRRPRQMLADQEYGGEMEGIFGIGASVTTWPGFSAHAVDWNAPFLSETGYRSFLGLSGTLMAGMTPDAFAREAVSAHIARDLKGKLRTIKPEYRTRAGAGP